MINELYDLSRALADASISTQSWHRKYKKIPNIKKDAPCVRIEIDNGKIMGISEVEENLGAILRKYGSNQGSYPCMNLMPLYRITDKEIKDKIDHIVPENIDLKEIKGWCVENNWNNKFYRKYKISMENMAQELYSKGKMYEPLQILFEESRYFQDVNYMHTELERIVFEMLEQKTNISLALKVLFYEGNAEKTQENDTGTLSVALESSKLITKGTPAVSSKFVKEINKILLAAENVQKDVNGVDAFGVPFALLEEPMPNIKLAGGFDVTIRTMFRDHKCQERYGRIENASYPISQSVRMNVQASLEWLSNEENKNKTWIKIGENEILFVYALKKPEIDNVAKMFGVEGNEEDFKTRTEKFIEGLRKGKDPKEESHAEGIAIFVLRKLDKARTKIVYTKQIDAYELEKCSEAWIYGCENLPKISIGRIQVPFPLSMANILNRFWKQDGEEILGKYKTISQYHGMEVLMEPSMSVVFDLHLLCEKAFSLGAYLGQSYAKACFNEEKDRKLLFQQPAWKNGRNILAFLGLILYRNNIQKEDYMENMPYLYGQLLKAADELQVLYCKVVRDGKIPPQLVGAGVFQSAVEMPVRTLSVLSQRIMPYYSWAKSYRWKKIETKGTESWKAQWLYNVCEKITTSLYAAWTPKTRFTDEEKAQLFIGYMAEFPKKVEKENNEEEENDETRN